MFDDDNNGNKKRYEDKNDKIISSFMSGFK